MEIHFYTVMGQGLVTDHWSLVVYWLDSVLSLPQPDLSLWVGTETLLQTAAGGGHQRSEPFDVGFPGSAEGKNPSANAGDARDAGLIPGSGKSPGVGSGNPLQYSCLKNQPHGQRSMAGYSPHDCKESDTTEHTPAHKLS